MKPGRDALISGSLFLIWLLTGAFVLFNLSWKSRVYALFTVAVSFALNTLLKVYFKRERVIEEKSRVYYLGVQKYSFPSAHTQLAFTASSIIESFYPPLKLYSFALAFITALSRLLLGRHSRGDIIWGAALGYLTGKIGVIIYGRV